MLKITIDNARKWIIAAASCSFFCAALNLLLFTPITLLDAVVYTLAGIFILRNNRTWATVGFFYFALAKLLNLDSVLSNSLVFTFVIVIILCLLQGMRAAYYTHKHIYTIPQEYIHEIIDTDFEFIGEVPQSGDQK
jgi:hypothetical protein